MSLEQFYNTQVEIYADSAFTEMLDIIDARVSPNALNELKGNGAGSFMVSKRDPKIMNNPSLLDYRNYVKVRNNGGVVGGFIIQTKKSTIVGAGEEADEMWEISGEGPKSWTRDASVYPPKGLKSSSGEERYFNFSTERGSWYVDANWPYAITRWYQSHKSSPKWPYPANWPDVPLSTWITYPGFTPSAPQGFLYYRHEFTTPGSDPLALTSYALFVAVDDSAEIFVDGEQKAVLEAPGYYDVTRIELELSPGPHVIGIKAYNIRGLAETLAALFTYGDPEKPTSAVVVNHTGMANTWRVNAYPSQEPGWTVGDILLTLLTEAEDRGVRFASNFTPQFTRTVDSAGVPWNGPVSYSFGIGSTYEEVFSAIEELGCDIYVDPDNLNLYAWNKRGVDRSAEALPEGDAVVFLPGRNLATAGETGQAEIANTLMLRTADGWVEKTATDTTSLTKYGRVETQMATQLSTSGATPLVDELFRQKALPEVSATFEIIPVEGAIPFQDFNVGDWVSAPGEVPGLLEKRRVMSISFSEDAATGKPVYALEFDTIFKDRQSELEKWVSRLANSSAIGGGFTNSSDLPSSVVVVPPGAPLGAVPDVPTGLIVNSVGKYQDDGGSSSDFGLTWNTVTTGVGYGSVLVDQYEVWGRLTSDTESQLLATVFDAMAYLKGFRTGEEWAFKVRAISKTGGPGDFSDEVVLQAAAPLLDLEAPSAPTLETSLGTVKVHWDGLLGGDPAPGWIRYIRVERQISGESAWVPIGSLVNYAMVDAPDATGQDVSYRLIAVDGYGRESDPSLPGTITVMGVREQDIDTIIADKINNALETAEEAWDAAAVAVVSAVPEYSSNSSEVTAPTTGWSTTPPTRTPGTFIWQRSVVTLGNGSTTTTTPVLVTGNAGPAGPAGDTGSTGVSVTSVQTYYRTTTAGAAAPAVPTTTTPPAPWQTTEPAYAANTDLWAVTRVGFSNSTFSYTPVSKVSSYTAAIVALTAANGKNKIIRSTSVASNPANYVANDLWWQYAGTQVIAMWMHDGSAWVAQTLTDSVISNLNAATITAGTIHADRFGANTVSAKTLLIGNFDNQIPDPGFMNVAASGWNSPSLQLMVGGGRSSGTNALRVVGTGAQKGAYNLTNIPVREGDIYRLSVWVKSSIALGAVSNMLAPYFQIDRLGTTMTTGGLNNSTAISANTWTKLQANFTIPAGGYQVRAGLYAQAALTAGATLDFTEPEMIRISDSTLIQDGAILSTKLDAEEIWAANAWLDVLRAGVIETNMLKAEVGESLNLSSNDSINIIVDRQSEAEAEIIAAQENAATAQAAADAAAGTAGQAQAEAAAAQAAADAARLVADAAESDLIAHQKVYSFGPEGATIGDTSSTFKLFLSNDGVQILENSTPVSTWDAEKMWVKTFEGENVVLANHSLEPYNNGTVVRATPQGS